MTQSDGRRRFVTPVGVLSPLSVEVPSMKTINEVSLTEVRLRRMYVDLSAMTTVAVNRFYLEIWSVFACLRASRQAPNLRSISKYRVENVRKN